MRSLRSAWILNIHGREFNIFLIESFQFIGRYVMYFDSTHVMHKMGHYIAMSSCRRVMFAAQAHLLCNRNIYSKNIDLIFHIGTYVQYVRNVSTYI